MVKLKTIETRNKFYSNVKQYYYNIVLNKLLKNNSDIKFLNTTKYNSQIWNVLKSFNTLTTRNCFVTDFGFYG